MSASGCLLSSNWQNWGKDYLGTSVFHLQSQSLGVFSDDSHVPSSSVIHAHMKEQRWIAVHAPDKHPHGSVLDIGY